MIWQLDNLNDGGAWVQFRKVDEFVKRDNMKKSSQVQMIVRNEKKKLSHIEGDQQQQEEQKEY
jgi:hypothetical protein